MTTASNQQRQAQQRQAQQRAKDFTAQTARYLDDNVFIKVLAWLLFAGLMAGLVTVAIINLKPYTVLMAGAGNQVSWVFAIPWLGAVLERMSVGLSLIGAVLIWAPVQILQCLWMLILIDGAAQRNAIRQSIAIQDELKPHEANRNAETRRAIKRASKVPFLFIKWAALLALGAYSFDMIVGLRVYPVWDSWSKFGLWLKTMNPIWLNTQNAIDLGVMLFSFEAVLILVIVVGQWVFHRSRVA